MMYVITYIIFVVRYIINNLNLYGKILKIMINDT